MKISDYSYMILMKAMEKEKEELSQLIESNKLHLEELDDAISWLDGEYWDQFKVEREQK